MDTDILQHLGGAGIATPAGGGIARNTCRYRGYFLSAATYQYNRNNQDIWLTSGGSDLVSLQGYKDKDFKEY